MAGNPFRKRKPLGHILVLVLMTLMVPALTTVIYFLHLSHLEGILTFNQPTFDANHIEPKTTRALSIMYITVGSIYLILKRKT